LHPFALFSAGNKTTVAEYLHVVGKRRLTQVHFLKQMTGTSLTILQNSQNLYTVFIAQSFENYRDLLIGKFHTLTSH